MASYRLSTLADRRLRDIYRYTRMRFSRAQANAYLLGLERTFERIALHPAIGRSLGGAHDIRRYVHRRHSIFYQVEDTGILIVDLLGAGQDPESHSLPKG